MTTTWTAFAIDLLTPILMALISLAAAYAVSAIRTHVSHVQTRDALLRATFATEAAVGTISQTMTDALKAGAADGKLTAEDARIARDLALGCARAYLGPKGTAVARQVLGDDDQALDRWLLGLIETTVREQKS